MKIKRILCMAFALVMLLGMAAGMSQTAYAEGNTTEITPTKTSGTMTITLTIAPPTVDVTGVTLDKTTAQTIEVNGKVSFTATVSPDNATDKKVKWSVGGTKADAVKLYTDEACTTEVGTAATSTLTVYAKGMSAGSATVTATSNADSTKTASCAVTVNAAHTHDDVTFTPWTAADGMPTEAGNYYLANDVTIGSTWNVPTGTTNLCLNGHGIIMTGTQRVITVPSGCTLNLCDCGTETEHKFTVNNPSAKGAGLAKVNDSLESGYQTFTGGYITGGNAGQGGGVYVDAGTFHMAGGTIIGNKATAGGFYDGGGVSLSNNASSRFVMTGGAIQHNTSTGRGPALGIANNATVELTGDARITHNSRDDNGWCGGISSYGTLTISGNVQITNNRGKTALHPQAGSVNISGAPVIFDNEVSAGDIHLDITLNIVGELTEGAKLGVYWDNAKVFTNSTDTSFNDVSKFVSDNPNLSVVKDADGQLSLRAEYAVTITAGDHMTKTAGSGDAEQTGLTGALTDVVYTANDGYYFPTDYSVAAVNGISVTRDSYTQITVSGTPTANATITLTAPTAKTTPDAPTTAAAVDCTTADNNDGKLTGVTTAMEYKKSDAADWTAGTDSDITGLVPGTYYVRVKATDTTLASDNQELTIKGFISYTVTFKVVNGSWDDETTEDKTVTLTGHDGDTLKLTADQIPAVGTKPADTYKAGAWDVVPSTETAITAATTYTYSYAAKDYTAAQGVIDAINALPDPTDVTTANKDAIEAARAAYDALPEDQKAKVEADTLKKLADAEAALKAIADAGKLYYTVSGDGQDHVIESGEDATFTVKRSVADENTFSRFSSIQVDGADVEASNYDKSEGSVIIKLKAAYLDTLSVGSHILKVLFTDGSVEIPFEVSVPVIVDPTSFEDIAVPSKTFTFKKVWEGGSEKSIDFTLYKLGDTVYHHGFDKKIISKTEWQYNAWFSEAVACYVIEEPVEGYKTRYENVGVYAGITDRCCDGGTIVNYKVPKTGDNANLMLWLGCALAGLALISASVYAGKRKKAHSK